MKWILLVIGVIVLFFLFNVFSSGFSAGMKLGGVMSFLPALIIVAVIALIIYFATKNRRL